MEIIKYKLLYTKKAVKDITNLKAAKLGNRAQFLCKSLETEPVPPMSKQLVGDLKGKYSIRISLKHRLVYQIIEPEKIIKILSLWGHYDDN